VKAKAEKMALETKQFQADAAAKESGGKTSKAELSWDEIYEQSIVYRNKYIAQVVTTF
jgi:hypothetical protein